MPCASSLVATTCIDYARCIITWWRRISLIAIIDQRRLFLGFLFFHSKSFPKWSCFFSICLILSLECSEIFFRKFSDQTQSTTLAPCWKRCFSSINLRNIRNPFSWAYGVIHDLVLTISFACAWIGFWHQISAKVEYSKRMCSYYNRKPKNVQ